MSNSLTPWPGTSYGPSSDNAEMLRLLRENNAMLKQIVAALSQNDSLHDFFVNVMANWAADDLSGR